MLVVHFNYGRVIKYVNGSMVCIIISPIAGEVDCPLYHDLRTPCAPGPDAAFLVSQNPSALLTVSNVGCIP